MSFKECQELLQRLDVSWHKILGLDGNFSLGRFEVELLISMISYKRVCDGIKSELVNAELFASDTDRYAAAYRYGIIPYEYKEIARWEYVSDQKDKIHALNVAVECINSLNSGKLADGESLIPEFNYSPVDRYSLNLIVDSWIGLLSQTDLGPKSVDDGTWEKLVKLIHYKLKG